MGNRQATTQRRLSRDAMRAAIEASMIEAPLPLGWEQAASKGVTYYIDHVNQVTTFNDPRLGTPRNTKKKSKRKLPKYKRDLYAKAQGFLAKLHQKQQDEGQLEIIVSREKLFQDSFNLIASLDSFTLTRRLFIKFEGEEGLDYGGMSREWFLLLSKEIFNEERKLFYTQDGRTYKFNRFAPKDETTLKYYHFVGRILGMAVYHSKVFYSYFTVPFYKSLLGRKLEFSDLKYEEPAVYKNLRILLHAEDVSTWDLDFTYTVKDENNKDKVIELKEGGSEIPLTNENRDEFVNLIFQYYMKSTESQLKELKNGFYQFIPENTLEEFDPEEIEQLLCGNTEIDVADLKSNTEYGDELSDSTNSVKLFWEVLSSFPQEDLRNFLLFATGSNKVPVGGFAHLYGSNGPQKFKIVLKTSPGLPTAHSCFNRLELGTYTEKEKLKKDILYAVNETAGFGLE